jgi:hypothetical protein
MNATPEFENQIADEVSALYDVVSVDDKTNAVRVIAQNKTLRNADAIVQMAVMRRGVEGCFYSEAPAGSYKDGDAWRGPNG